MCSQIAHDYYLPAVLRLYNVTLNEELAAATLQPAWMDLVQRVYAPEGN